MGRYGVTWDRYLVQTEICDKMIERPYQNRRYFRNQSQMLFENSRSTVVVDVPVGKGHVVLFAIRPFWRWQTQGSHALVFNTVLHWNDLHSGWPEREEEQEEEGTHTFARGMVGMAVILQVKRLV